jgi:hypothetical protein
MFHFVCGVLVPAAFVYVGIEVWQLAFDDKFHVSPQSVIPVLTRINVAAVIFRALINSTAGCLVAGNQIVDAALA